jgi:arylsulfatase A-like enzyme
MITYLDHQIGRLLGRMMELGIFDDTLIIYTTDHGEKLGDFGSFWKASFLEPSARIPLIVKWPKSMDLEPGRSIESLACLEDLLPTLCDFGGAKIPDGIDGQNLRPAIEGSGKSTRPYIWGQFGEATHMIRTERFKYIYYPDDGRELLFDMAADPNELTDLSIDENLTRPLREQLQETLAQKDHPHLTGGSLLNRQAKKPPVSEVRAQNLMWQGLRRAGQKTDLTLSRRG